MDMGAPIPIRPHRIDFQALYVRTKLSMTSGRAECSYYNREGVDVGKVTEMSDEVGAITVNNFYIA